MLTVDPPDHTRYRATVARSFNARVIGALRPEITAIVDDELDLILGHGMVDVNARFSVGVPVRVIVRALNLDPGREADIKQWSDATTCATFSSNSRSRPRRSSNGRALPDGERRGVRPAQPGFHVCHRKGDGVVARGERHIFEVGVEPLNVVEAAIGGSG